MPKKTKRIPLADFMRDTYPHLDGKTPIKSRWDSVEGTEKLINNFDERDELTKQKDKYEEKLKNLKIQINELEHKIINLEFIRKQLESSETYYKSKCTSVEVTNKKLYVIIEDLLKKIGNVPYEIKEHIKNYKKDAMRTKIDEIIKESKLHKYESELEENTCCICMFNKPNVLVKCHENYGHKFCIDCIKDTNGVKDICPMCRGEYNDIIRII